MQCSESANVYNELLLITIQVNSTRKAG